MGVEEKKIVCWASPGCIHQCGLIATVKDGELVGLRGNPDYPTPNHGCGDRMPHHTKWLYSSEQLLYPLKRKGERGENQWERISWDQALDEIATKLADLKQEYGAETLAVHEGTYRNDITACAPASSTSSRTPRTSAAPAPSAAATRSPSTTPSWA